MSYHYFGLRFGRLSRFGWVSRKVSLDTVKFSDPNSGSHVAVWLGANSRDMKSWVQGGIEQSSFDKNPYAYIEVGFHGEQVSYQYWPVKLGQKVKVKIVRSQGLWKIVLSFAESSHVSKKISIRDPVLDSMLEVEGRAMAAGHVGTQHVRGNTLKRRVP